MVPFLFLVPRFRRSVVCEGCGMRDALMRLLEPPIEALGFELIDVEFAREGRGGVLRIYIDRGAGGDHRAGGPIKR